MAASELEAGLKSDRMESMPAPRSTMDPPFSKQELIDLFQLAPFGFHTCSGTGEILWANNTLLEMLGYSASEYIGHSIREFLFDLSAHETFSETLMSGQMEKGHEYKLIGKNGVVKSLVGDTRLKFNPDGTVASTQSFIRVDTELLVEEAVNHERTKNFAVLAAEKQRFIRLMFHEIRTPLHNLSSSFHNSIILSNLPRDITDEMKFQMDSCTGLVEDLSFATMFESDKKLVPHPSGIRIRNELDMILQYVNYCYGSDLQAKNVKICTAIAVNLPEVISADKSLVRVLANLINNAVRFCCAEGTIMINITYQRTRKNSRMGSISLADTFATNKLSVSVTNTVTAKMDLAHINKLFHSYYTHTSMVVDKTVSSNGSGSSSSSAGGGAVGGGGGGRLSGGIATGNRSPKSPKPTSYTVTSTSNSSNSPDETSQEVVEEPDEKTMDAISQSLISDEGLGLGLYVSYNIVQCLGGVLDCSATHTESCFSFSINVGSSGEQVTDPRFAALKRENWSNVSDSLVGEMQVTNVKINPPSDISTASVAYTQRLPSPRVISKMPTPRSFPNMNIQITNDNDPANLPFIPPVKAKYHVLVVDDSPICRKVLTKSLELNGYSADVACDGQEACDKLAHEPCQFDAVLMDLRMPVMDGITATRICKKRPFLASLPIIIVTAEMGEDIRTSAMAAKAACFISKPARLSELLDALQKYIVPK